MVNNNVQNVRFLRNGALYATREKALNKLNEQNLAAEQDGSIILARYGSGNTVKTLVGLVYVNGENKSLTIFDIEGASGDVENLRQEIDAKLGDGIKSDNTATAQLTALSGSASDTSATTSVWGAKKYADGLKNAMDYAGLTADENKVVYNVTEADGIVAAEAKNISSFKLAGYAVGSDDKIAANDTIGEALGKLQGQIDSMNKAAEAVDGQVVTTVVEKDGKVTETKANVKDLQLGGYSKEADTTGDITATDTINTALSKLENKVGTNKVTNADHSIVVTEPTGTTTTDIKVNIKSGEQVIKLGDNGIYTNLNLVKITDGLTANVKEKYQLLASDNSQIGVDIEIPKDSALQNVYLGHVDDKLTNADAQGESVDTTITSGSGDAALVYVMQLSSGKYKLTAVNVESFLQESEFADGLQVNNHVVSVKVDTSSEQVTIGENTTGDVLTVGSNGVKVSNVQNAINYAISKLDANVTGGDITSKHVQVVVDEVDGKVTAVTVNEANIADASKLEDLSGKTVTEVASSNNSIKATLSDAADKTKHLDIITDASKIKMSGFTKADALTGIKESSSVTDALLEVDKVITEKAEVISTALNDLETTKAEKTALDAEIAARKAVDGQSGQTYAANTSANYISVATSLNDADIKLDAALKSLSNETVNQVKVNGVVLKKENNAVNAQIKAAAGTGAETAAIAVNTDNSTGAVTISLLELDCGTY